MKVVVTGTFTVESLGEPLAYLLSAAGLSASVEFGPYGQVFQQLLDPSSQTAQNKDGVNVVLVRFEDLAKSSRNSDDTCGAFTPEMIEQVEANASEVIGALRSAAERSSTPTLVLLCHTSLAFAANSQALLMCDRLEEKFAAYLQSSGNVYLLSSRQLSELYPVEEYDDPAANALAHVPYKPAYFAALAAAIARRIYRIKSAPHKVVVLDCDQTIWKGVCGEVGANGVEFDAPRLALQEFMVEQQRAGMVLCLCSKNNEEDVWEVFAQRKEMPLRRDHIVSWRINWNNKSQNLKALAAELNLGLDSFIFVDDDPVVCAEVRSNCPEVLTLQLPHEVENIPRFLRNVWAFDHLPITREDEQRAQLYKENAIRERLRQEAPSYDTFIAGLGLQIDIAPINREQIARVSQLTQRTNQFNFTTIRRSEAEIERLAAQPDTECLVVEVSDRFGDYGLVGVVIFHSTVSRLEVDSFLLSCRALGRGVEHRMVAKLGELALEHGLDTVECNFVATRKNRPALEFLETLDEQFRETTADGLRVVLPAQSATALEFRPAAARELAETGDEATSAANLVAGTGNDPKSASLFHNRIANELFDAPSILTALRGKIHDRRQTATGYEAPEGELESELADLWMNVLNVRQVGRNDNFFELGGDSLVGVQLFSEIEDQFGKRLSMATLLEAPTLATLAEKLRSDDSPQWSSLVPIKTGGGKPPLFCMHAAGGHVLFYRDLANYLGPDQPVYGLQARGLDRAQTHHDRVEDMAAYYLTEVRHLQPAGPYYLCGSSFGGLVAYEMAQQLTREGHEVALLALFDTYGPGYPQIRKDASVIKQRLHALLSLVGRIGDNLRALNSWGKIAYIVNRVKKVRTIAQRKYAWKKNEFERKFSAATGRELPADLQRNHKAIERALKSYKQERYAGHLTLFRASQQPYGAIPNPTLGWEQVVNGGIEVHEVPGAHGAVTVEPYARHLAEKLTPCLERAHGRSERRMGRLPAGSVNYQEAELALATTE
jgi:FkbH-like protein